MEPNIKHRWSRATVLALSSGLAWATAAQAEDPADGTEVILTGYLFASALEGQASAAPGLPVADIDLSFRDVLEDLDFGFMSALELRRGRWGFVADLMYSNVSPGGTVPGPVPVSVGLDQKSLTLQGTVFYRVHEDPKVKVDLGGGLRSWTIDSVGTVSAGPPASAGFSHTESWIDPVLAARMTAQIDGPWSVTLAGDVGGSGSGSDLTWQLLGTVNFQKNDKLTFRAGYRVLSVDYSDSGFVYDVTMQGPVVGVSIRF